MENETMETGELTEEATLEAFEAGWNEQDDTPADGGEHQPADGEGRQSADQAAGAPETQPPADDAADAGKPGEEAAGNPPAPQNPQPQQPRMFQLRHMDDPPKDYTEAQMVALAQQGLDYPRIRQERDEAKPFMGVLKRAAEKAHMTLEQYGKWFQEQELIGDSDMTHEQARTKLDYEEQKAFLAENQRQKEEAAAQQQAQSDGIRANLDEFQKMFPSVYKAVLAAEDPRTVIPPAVWQAVDNGQSLSLAYAMYALGQSQQQAQQIKEQAAAETLNQQNAGSSTGSMGSAGNTPRVRDPFLDGWNEGN